MNVQSDIIIYFIKLYVISLYTYYIFEKISNIKKHNIKILILVLIFSFVLGIVCTYIKFFINSSLSLIILCFCYGSSLGIITKNKICYSMITTLTAWAISLICLGMSIIIAYFPYKLFNIRNNYANLILILLIQFAFIFSFLKIKRFKNGFDFLYKKVNNELAEIIMINISVMILIVYCLLGSIFEEIKKNLLIAFIILGITTLGIIQKMLIMYNKQKLLENTINDYKDIINKKDEEITRLANEKTNYSKIAHEFYNRQKALEMMVRESVDKYKMETDEELEVLTKVENLTKEYSKKIEAIKTLPELQKADISEIDNMLKYMQSECYKNNIEFKLKIVGNIHYLTNNIIEKNKLETLIGDHIRDAIIAINSSNNTNKEILVILGIKDNKYQFCVYDTGIEFEINTLLKLGLERVTTHKNDGGSGIGFMTTFETLKECKASLIIEELNKETNSYTKAVIIRFDGKNEYKIQSYRADEIKKQNKDNRITIEKL